MTTTAQAASDHEGTNEASESTTTFPIAMNKLLEKNQITEESFLAQIDFAMKRATLL